MYVRTYACLHLHFPRTSCDHVIGGLGFEAAGKMAPGFGFVCICTSRLTLSSRACTYHVRVCVRVCVCVYVLISTDAL